MSGMDRKELVVKWQEKLQLLSSISQRISKFMKEEQDKISHLIANENIHPAKVDEAIIHVSTFFKDIGDLFTKHAPECHLRQPKYTFFPQSNLNFYTMKYAFGHGPTDFSLIHTLKKKMVKEIKSKLRQKIKSNELSKLESVNENDCVVALNMRRQLVRAVVTPCQPELDTVTLLDIDSGDIVLGCRKNLYEVDQEAASVEAICARCYLHGDMADINKYWSSDLAKYFKSALNFGELQVSCKHEDDSFWPPRYSVCIDICIAGDCVVNVNEWICDRLLPALRRESINCCDLNNVLKNLSMSLLVPYANTDSSHGSDSVTSSSSTPTSQCSSSTESDESNTNVFIDQKLASPNYNIDRQKNIDVIYCNSHMSPSSESVLGQSSSKCDCGSDCDFISSSCPEEIAIKNPKLPRITSVIPSLTQTPTGTVFHHDLQQQTKRSLLPTPVTNGHQGMGLNEAMSSNSSEHMFFNDIPQYSQVNGRSNTESFPNISHHKNLVSRRQNSDQASSYRANPYHHNSASGDSYHEEDEIVVPIPHNGPNSRGEVIPFKAHTHQCRSEALFSCQPIKLSQPLPILKPNQEIIVKVAHFEHPGLIFVHIPNEPTLQMLDLEEEMVQYYSGVENHIILSDPDEVRHHLGVFVACKWTDDRWYRAKVLDWKLAKEKHFKVMFVDHGNTDIVPIQNIQPLHPRFAQLPVVAFECHLADLAPSDGKKWSPNALEIFHSYFEKISYDEEVHMTVHPSSNKSSSSWSVSIRKTTGECINEILVKSGHAHSIKQNGYSPPRNGVHSSEKSHSQSELTDDLPLPLDNVSETSSVKDGEAVSFYAKQIQQNKVKNKRVLQSILVDVKSNVNVMVLMRGLPGSGKSTAVTKLIKELKKVNKEVNPVTLSADHYFMKGGQYCYDGRQVKAAHAWNQERARKALEEHISPVIIDNTNVEEFEILNYYNLAYYNWYKFYVLEPETDWAFNVDELSCRNIHDVPKESLTRMLLQYCFPSNQRWLDDSQVQEKTQESVENVEECAKQLNELAC